jgi:hypothetical protein
VSLGEKRIWGKNIRTNITETGCEDVNSTALSQNTVKWRDFETQ